MANSIFHNKLTDYAFDNLIQNKKSIDNTTLNSQKNHIVAKAADRNIEELVQQLATYSYLKENQITFVESIAEKQKKLVTKQEILTEKDYLILSNFTRTQITLDSLLSKLNNLDFLAVLNGNENLSLIKSLNDSFARNTRQTDYLNVLQNLKDKKVINQEEFNKKNQLQNIDFNYLSNIKQNNNINLNSKILNQIDSQSDVSEAFAEAIAEITGQMEEIEKLYSVLNTFETGLEDYFDSRKYQPGYEYVYVEAFVWQLFILDAKGEIDISHELEKLGYNNINLGHLFFLSTSKGPLIVSRMYDELAPYSDYFYALDDPIITECMNYFHTPGSEEAIISSLENRNTYDSLMTDLGVDMRIMIIVYYLKTDAKDHTGPEITSNIYEIMTVSGLEETEALVESLLNPSGLDPNDPSYKTAEDAFNEFGLSFDEQTGEMIIDPSLNEQRTNALYNSSKNLAVVEGMTRDENYFEAMNRLADILRILYDLQKQWINTTKDTTSRTTANI